MVSQLKSIYALFIGAAILITAIETNSMHKTCCRRLFFQSDLIASRAILKGVLCTLGITFGTKFALDLAIKTLRKENSCTNTQ